ncbi:MAG: hypothetical protein BGO27_04115 [Alphaproteobacteria bacterium 33-17]|nr:MAG: hypothetical protein BGO27_04115 [Alphaproteobacteria bacterium 33-17]
MIYNITLNWLNIKKALGMALCRPDQFFKKLFGYLSFQWYKLLTKFLTKVQQSSSFYFQAVPDGRLTFQDDYYFSIKADKIYSNFLITSVGNAGSLWLAQSLHMHPEILCTMGINNPLISLKYYYNNNEQKNIIDALLKNEVKNFGFETPNDDNEFSDLSIIKNYLITQNIEKDEIRKHIKKLANTRNIADLCIWIFDELNDLRLIKPAKFIGNIHGVTMTSLHKNFSKINNSQEIKFADLARNPITRRESTINQYVRHYNYNIKLQSDINNIFSSHKDIIKYYEKHFNADFTLIRNKCSFYLDMVLRSTLNTANEYRNYYIPVIHFEKMRSDPDYFASIISYISDFQLQCDDEYLAKVFSDKNLNEGRINGQTKSHLSPQEVFYSWPEWERHMFVDEAKKHDILKAYLKIGYDISFILNVT